MRYLHTMLRVRNLDAALKFYQDALGLKEVRRVDNEKAKFIIGTRRNTARTAISATSPTRSTTSTRPATG